MWGGGGPHACRAESGRENSGHSAGVAQGSRGQGSTAGSCTCEEGGEVAALGVPAGAVQGLSAPRRAGGSHHQLAALDGRGGGAAGR